MWLHVYEGLSMTNQHWTAWQSDSPAGSGSPLCCSLVVTRAKLHLSCTHKRSAEYCGMRPQDQKARAPLKTNSCSHASMRLTEEVVFTSNLFYTISACTTLIMIANSSSHSDGRAEQKWHSCQPHSKNQILKSSSFLGWNTIHPARYTGLQLF